MHPPTFTKLFYETWLGSIGKKEEKKIIENQRKDNRFYFTMFFESPNMWREMNRERGVEKKRITVESAAGDEDCCTEVGTGV